MRSREAEGNKAAKPTATQKLKNDIRNAGRHVLGFHDLCSKDFCKHSPDDTAQDEDDEHVIEEGLIFDQSKYWKDSETNPSKEEEEDLRRGGPKQTEDDEMKTILKDVYIILNRLADKAHRLIGNFTSNLAESWMNIRCKFDGGKMYNKNFRSAFYGRCYGGALRSILGPAWSPQVYQTVTEKRPNNVFIRTYQKRAKKHVTTLKSAKKTENVMKRKKRKAQSMVQSQSKQAKLSYGHAILNDSEDISKEELDKRCKDYLKETIDKSNIEDIEQTTRGQGCNELWQVERKKRLTSSNFGTVMSRSINNNSHKLVENLLYSKFQGNMYTIRGLAEEDNARSEYKHYQQERNHQISNILVPGLQVDKHTKFLAASSDGIVISNKGKEGLIEIKTVLQNKRTMIKDAAKNDKQFCIKYDDGKYYLKKNHKFFYQIQGQMNIMGYKWCDLVLRKTTPHDLYVERITIDTDLWENVMLPKLTAFYMTHLLPEIVSPRHGTITGIRKPSLPWFESPAPSKKRIVQRKQPESISTDKSESRPITAASPDPQPSTSSETQHPTPLPATRRRERRMKFVGRRIEHLWTEADGSNKWYRGTILTVIGKDGDLDAVYEVLYDNDDTSYEADSLPRDYKDGSVKFIDL